MTFEYLKGNIEDLQLILDLSYDMITISDDKGRFTTASKSCEKFFGISEDKLIGMGPKDLEKNVLDHSITGKVISTKKKTTMVQSTKTGKILLATAYPVIKNGSIYKIITFSKDITEEKKLEGQLERLTDELEWYKNEFKKRQTDSLKNPVISSSSMKQVMDMVKHIANMNVIVLLLGETGVGKGYIASLIHNLSNRREHPFITVNCAAIPKELLESELFGYEEGAFTGAKKGGKKGLFEIAGEGTIFLDEIGDMPLELQVKLLHVLDKKTITRVGGEVKINIKARIVTATNKDLKEAVKAGFFREDLYYRISVLPIVIPPLSQRREDIPILIDVFLEQFNKEYKVQKKISTSGYIALMFRHYPGNVRELKHTIERLVITSVSDTITEELISSFNNDAIPVLEEIPENMSLKEVMDNYEKKLLTWAILKYGTTRKVGQALGIEQSTVAKKIKRLGIKR